MGIADGFVMKAIQEWGDPEEQRIRAVQDVLDAAGFDASATCWPIFGGIWPKPCTGPQGKEASDWLLDLTETMPRGKYELEVQHVQQCIEARRAEVAGLTS